MNNKQQTAVDLFHDKVNELIVGKKTITSNDLGKIWLVCKEMEKEQMIKNITDYNLVVTEFLLNPLFNLEHSQHGIACEKLSDIRNKFISNHIVNYNETYGGNK